MVLIGIDPHELTNLVKTLDGDKNVNSSRKLSTELKIALALVEDKLQVA